MRIFTDLNRSSAAQGLPRGDALSEGSRAAHAPVEIRSRYPASDTPAPSGSATQVWAGRSGRLYQASIVDLVVCRAPAKAAYVLARRDATGRPQALFAGLALSAAPTVNLARIRQRAARLGAEEVHLIDLGHSAGTYVGRRLVRDVRAGLSGLV